MAVKLQRAPFARILVEIGFKGAGEWDDTKLQSSIVDFKDIDFGEEKTAALGEAEVATRKAILDGLAAKETFEFEGDKLTPAAAPAEKKSRKKKDKAEGDATAATSAEGGTPAEPKAKKEKKPKEPKPPKEAKITAPVLCGQLIAKETLEKGITETMVTEFGLRYGRANPYRTWFDFKASWHAIRGFLDTPIENAPGVQVSNTRPFLAGRILKEKGLNAEITDELVAELDKRYGKANAGESVSTFRIAKGAIEGYQKGAPEGPVPAAPPAEPKDEAPAPAPEADAKTEAPAAAAT